MSTSTAEITQWLKNILSNEDLSDFTINLQGSSGKGDGYTGDIIFIKVLAHTRNNSTKQFDLALKCSKRSEAMRKSLPVKELFANENHIYSTVFPEFRRFQVSKELKEIFDGEVKYYGSIVNPTMEVLAFQDLKSAGYSLWDRRTPMSIEHVELVLREYAKFHATGATMKVQHPEEFQKMVDGLEKGLRTICFVFRF